MPTPIWTGSGGCWRKAQLADSGVWRYVSLSGSRGGSVKLLLIIPALLSAALIYISADRGTGLSAWMRDRDALESSEEQIARLEAEIVHLKAEVGRLERDPFAIERAIREDLEYARADETLVRLPKALLLTPVPTPDAARSRIP